MANFLKKKAPNKGFWTGGPIEKARKVDLKGFCKSSGLGLRMTNLSLLDQALTHRSYSNELGRRVADNQRLEYLGDSILGLVINEHLFQQNPEFNEGDLAAIKSAVVAEQPLARVARDLQLGRLLRLGRGEKGSGGSDRDSNLADALEAVVAAIYMVAGLGVVRKFILRHFHQILIECSDPASAQDPKTRLQEYCQREYRQVPVYKVVERSGPDHRQRFKVAVTLENRNLGQGEGLSRKKAEQAAARIALKQIGEQG